LKTELETAYALRVEYGLSLEHIATLTDQPIDTIQKWSREHAWNDTVANINLVPARLKAECYQQCDKLLANAQAEVRLLNDKEVERFKKLISIIDKLDYEQSPRVQMEVMMKFNNYLVQRKPELARDIVPYEMEYAKQIMSKTSKMAMKSKSN
jgi:hypothetical protein